MGARLWGPVLLPTHVAITAVRPESSGECSRPRRGLWGAPLGCKPRVLASRSSARGTALPFSQQTENSFTFWREEGLGLEPPFLSSCLPVLHILRGTGPAPDPCLGHSRLSVCVATGPALLGARMAWGVSHCRFSSELRAGLDWDGCLCWRGWGAVSWGNWLRRQGGAGGGLGSRSPPAGAMTTAAEVPPVRDSSHPGAPPMESRV